MRKIVCYLVGAAALLVMTSALARAQEFKPYPGSQLDEKLSREASAVATDRESKVYTTSDSFDKVYAFYKGLYKQDTKMPAGPKLPSGQQVQWAFFLIDGGKDLSTSKLWMKVQYPMLAGPDGKDVRNITHIQVVRKQ
ncbi:MAG: hypothetical protein ABSC08_05675 [Bryobacteraceae bacterium]